MMAHHGIGPDNQFEDVLKNVEFDDSKIKEQLKKFEKPRTYPDGRLGAMDDGELAIAITEKNGRVLIHFGKPIEWIGFTPEQAVEIAQSLWTYSNKAAEIEHN